MRKRLLAAGAVTVFLLSSGLAEADVGQKTSTSLADSGYHTIQPYNPSQNLGYNKRSYVVGPGGTNPALNPTNSGGGSGSSGSSYRDAGAGSGSSSGSSGGSGGSGSSGGGSGDRSSGSSQVEPGSGSRTIMPVPGNFNPASKIVGPGGTNPALNSTGGTALNPTNSGGQSSGSGQNKALVPALPGLYPPGVDGSIKTSGGTTKTTAGTTKNQGNAANQPSGNSGNTSQPSNKQWVSVAVTSGASAPSDVSAPPGVSVKSGDQREYFTPSTPTRVPQGALDRLANGLESLKNVFARVLQMS